ncbi:helix-turn-helix domain-containing protein [Paenibacillus sp. MABNR03]|uniref:AraC family transcriptional regulator n=1 Tax=Paenibacillus sp. MABNR03 TaxID=3142626 RepID=UPI003D2AB1F4
MSILGKEQFDLACRRTSTATFREIFHAHSQMEVTYIHDGYGQLITEGQAFPLEPGTLMIFRPFQLHQVQIQVTDEHPFVRSVLMYDLDLLKGSWRHFTAIHDFVQELLGQNSPIAPFILPSASMLVQLMEQFAQVHPNLLPYEGEEHIRLFLLHLLGQLKYIWEEGKHSPSQLVPPTSSSLLHPHAEAVMQWIEEHYDEPFHLKDLASEMHMSLYHLSHVFKKATGTTIVAYAQATRIRHACILLARTSYSVPEIGHRVGMSTPSYFCKVFRTVTGTTPHQYRLNVQGRT